MTELEMKQVNTIYLQAVEWMRSIRIIVIAILAMQFVILAALIKVST